MRLRYTRPARRSIDDVLTHVAARSPQGADRLLARILAAAALIADHPRAGQATDRAGVRRVVLTP